MELKIKQKFVRLWKAEYAATCKVHEISEKIDIAYRWERPVQRLQNNLAAWEKKQSAAGDLIDEGISSGAFPANAVELCAELLGSLTGYVADCFADCYAVASAEF